MNVLFKTLGFVFAILFAIGAVLQYNDPDSLHWIIVYGIAALVSLLFALKKVKFVVPLVLGVFAFIGFVYLYPSDFQGFDLKIAPSLLLQVQLKNENNGKL